MAVWIIPLYYSLLKLSFQYADGFFAQKTAVLFPNGIIIIKICHSEEF
ncbi:MAG: hypothetical protein IKU47_03860 [Oscillospiraceae bacterium]|nr:hypothetical protein [Oscillospiraceae bacterium]